MVTAVESQGYAERRSSRRYPFPREGHPHLTATVGFAPRQSGLVRDLSRGGISWLMHNVPESDAVLPVWVPSMDEASSRMLLVKVVHVCPTGNGLFRVGGLFVDTVSSDLVGPLLA